MLQTLVLWVLRHSKAVGDILKDVYKPGRKTDDSNISLAVHCWGMDREKNKYYLIEGRGTAKPVVVILNVIICKSSFEC